MYGVDGSNECPPKSARIVDAAACQAAATAAGKPWGGIGTYSTLPRGCHLSKLDNTVFLNTGAVGAGCSIHRLLCAAPTGAPAPPQLPITGVHGGVRRAREHHARYAVSP
jgi:hypothetical protein